MKDMMWFGFWIYLSICVGVDAYLFSKGYDGYFFKHSTPAEKQIQQLKIDKMRQWESDNE